AEACRSGDVASGRAPADGVQDVEQLRAELNAVTLGDGEILANRAIEIEQARSALRAYSCAAEFAEGRDAVGAGSAVYAGGAEGRRCDVTEPAIDGASRGVGQVLVAVGARVASRAAA